MLLKTLEHYGEQGVYQTQESWQQACDQLLELYAHRFWNCGYNDLNDEQQNNAFEWACSKA